jgi:hypothetical protein
MHLGRISVLYHEALGAEFHTEARPSVRLCVRPELARCVHCAACTYGTKPRRRPQAAQQGEGFRRHALGDGMHCPSAARHAAERPKDYIYAGSARFFFFNYAPTRNPEFW